ncbi:hypothetical protein ABIC90_000649 [Variovorax boronicumulans]
MTKRPATTLRGPMDEGFGFAGGRGVKTCELVFNPAKRMLTQALTSPKNTDIFDDTMLLVDDFLY